MNNQLCGYLFSICPPCELFRVGIPISFLPVPPELVAFSQPLLRGREASFVILGSEKGLTKQCHADVLAMDLSLTFAVRAGPTLQRLLHVSNPVTWTILLFSCSVGSNSLQPHGLQPTRLLCSWDFPDKNTRVSCHALLQGIFPAQGSNLRLLRLLHCR